MREYENNIAAAINAFRQGQMVILTDSHDRENEGDLIFPAEIITPEIINQMIRYGSGIVCLSLTDEQVKKLGLRLMTPRDDSAPKHQAAFTLSIEAKNGISTGVSAADRATTILAAVNGTPDDILSPGHVFPLRAAKGGVLVRTGHTEGSTDLAQLAGFQPAAVICELMNPDGTMMRNEQIRAFAEKNNICVVSIEDLIHYRRQHENLVAEEITTNLPLEEYGDFKLTVVKEKCNHKEHMILSKDSVNKDVPPLVRIHSSCATGDIFGSKRCDCKAQLHHSLKRISLEGGMLFYLPQEGRDIGLFNKIKAYSLQDQGKDTIEANLALGFPADAREYYIVANLLKNKAISNIRLLTNNPNKVENLHHYGINTITIESLPVHSNTCNKDYLLTKKEKFNHSIEI